MMLADTDDADDVDDANKILVSSQSVISSAEELPPDENSRHRRSSSYLQE